MMAFAYHNTNTRNKRLQIGTFPGRMSFGDALVAHSVDMWASEAEAFVSWDARHFRGKIGVTALTPREFLQKS